MTHAPGPYVWRVDVGGTVIKSSDKIVGTERKALWGFDASEVLGDFARLCALDVVHLWDCPDVVAQFLKTGDPDIRVAARAAAHDAVHDAAPPDAARAAARAAAQTAVSYAAWDAAWATAQATAQATARYAARDAAWATARYAARGAAWATVRYAASYAAGKKQNNRLIRMLMNEAKLRGIR